MGWGTGVSRLMEGDPWVMTPAAAAAADNDWRCVPHTVSHALRGRTARLARAQLWPPRWQYQPRHGHKFEAPQTPTAGRMPGYATARMRRNCSDCSMGWRDHTKRGHPRRGAHCMLALQMGVPECPAASRERSMSLAVTQVQYELTCRGSSIGRGSSQAADAARCALP